MRVIAVCNEGGEIAVLMTAPEGGLRPSLEYLEPNQREVELDLPDISEDFDRQEIHRRLNDLRNGFLVERSQGTLIPRNNTPCS
jgi:hypothetical protein